MTPDRGVALVLVLLVTSFLSALGLGLALIVWMDGLATGNLRGAAALLHAADAAIELAARDLSSVDWDLALTGQIHGGVIDGAPTGERPLPGGGALDLSAITNRLNCGSPDACTSGQIGAVTRERPWGANNAHWRLFTYGGVGNFVQPAQPLDGYILLWIADDGREEDGDPQRDGAVDTPGHGVLRVRAAAYGHSGVRRTVEAEFVRLCLDAAEPCRARIRVQSWHERRRVVP